MKSIIPNTLTLSNLACGLFAINAIFTNDYIMAAWLIAFAQVFDFFDGFVARLLKVNSEMGKQLDSLADMVSFGVVPGFMVFKLIKLSMQGAEPIPEFLPFIAFLIPIFSALRLAKFNIDTRQSEHFIGLPTPANTLLIMSIALYGVFGDSENVSQLILHPFFLVGLTLITSFLLVAEIPLLSLKFKSMNFKENRSRFILLLMIIVLFLIFRIRALVFIIPLYLILSLIFKPKKN